MRQKKPSTRLLIWPLNTIIRGGFARYTPSLATYYWFVEDNYPETFKALEEALKISEEVKDIVSLVLASYWYGCALGWNCEFERSANYFQRALDINLAAKNLWGIAAMKSNLAYFSYYYNGKINLQFETTNEGLRIAEESGDIYSKGNGIRKSRNFLLRKGITGRG